MSVVLYFCACSVLTVVFFVGVSFFQQCHINYNFIYCYHPCHCYGTTYLLYHSKRRTTTRIMWSPIVLHPLNLMIVPCLFHFFARVILRAVGLQNLMTMTTMTTKLTMVIAMMTTNCVATIWNYLKQQVLVIKVAKLNHKHHHRNVVTKYILFYPPAPETRNTSSFDETRGYEMVAYMD